MKKKEKTAEIFKIFDELKELQRKERELSCRIFKIETVGLMISKGQPITKDCEYYINGKNDKKLDEMKQSNRVLNLNYPK